LTNTRVSIWPANEKVAKVLPLHEPFLLVFRYRQAAAGGPAFNKDIQATAANSSMDSSKRWVLRHKTQLSPENQYPDKVPSSCCPELAEKCLSFKK